ncbi:hypothetical protein [Pseudonocardia zijingensis]|uniref:HEAT repeat protein n=1 Tax=Pseudonocardia zijingensis TaxID=153376 RepID=A0ABP3ZV85_9PSEU
MPGEGEPIEAKQADEPHSEDEQRVQSNPKRSDDGDPEPEFEEVLRYAKQFINYGNTVLYLAPNASAGANVRIPARLLSDDDVHAELTYFVPPASYVEASAKLQRRRLLILCGTQGTGRRCGALALLTLAAPPDVDHLEPVTELLPRTTIEELLHLTLKPNRRYVLPDLVTGGISSERLRFRLDELSAHLTSAGAVLVATSNSPADFFPSHAVDLGRIECSKVLDAYLRRQTHDYDDDTVENLRSVASKRRPAEMATFLTLLEESGPHTVSEHFENGDQQTVNSLILQHPESYELLPLIAASFLPGASERYYEMHLDQLREHVDQHAQRTRWSRDYKDCIVQSRSDRATWVVSREPPLDRLERTVKLADTVESAHLLTRLRQHYGRELWGPVHSWLTERPRKMHVRDETSLAEGMATFARVDAAGARAVLDAWAIEKELPPRWAAAAALSAMCRDNNADFALRIAIVWSSRSRREKIVAAMAFSQALGLQRPVEALSRLWYLCLGDMIVARLARIQFVAFIRVTAHDTDMLRLTLSIVNWQLEQQLLGQAYRDKSVSQAISTVTALLSADVTPDTSLTLHALRSLPDHIDLLGSLWAQVLRTWPHRVAGLDVLRVAHGALHSVGQSDAFIKLGRSIASRVTRQEWEWMCRDLALPTAWMPTMFRTEIAV